MSMYVTASKHIKILLDEFLKTLWRWHYSVRNPVHIVYSIYLVFHLITYYVWRHSVLLQKNFRQSVSTRFSGPLIFGRSSWVLVTNDTMKEIFLKYYTPDTIDI